MDNLSKLEIINRLSSESSVKKIENLLKNIQFISSDVISILLNPDVERFILDFIGFEDVLRELHSSFEPKDNVTIQDINNMLSAKLSLSNNINSQETLKADTQEHNDTGAKSTSVPVEPEAQEQETGQPGAEQGAEPTMTPEQMKKTFEARDSYLDNSSHSSKITGVGENATDELGEIVDTSYLPEYIPDVEELVQSIVVRNRAVFESCLQLDRPYGMLYDKGLLSYSVVDGKVMYRAGENREGKSLFERLYKAILAGALQGNSSYQVNCAKSLRNVPNAENLFNLNATYYPGFMFKYALGIVDGKPYKAWGKFEEALAENVRDKLKRLYTKGQIFFDSIGKIERAFSTSMLVLSYEPRVGIKIRLSLPGLKLDPDKIEKSIRTTQTFNNASITVLSMGGNDDVVDIQILQDEDKYLNRPYWAYQAMGVKINNNESVSLSAGLPIGRRANGEIVDFRLDPSTRFLNFLAAGSGSGKGVMTLSIVAAAVGSGIPVMYIDFKPDMAEIFWKIEEQLGIKTFTYDAMGTNRKGTAGEREFKSSLPEYVQSELGQYSSVIFYMKAVQLMCAIAQYRSENGFDKEIMFVFDETQALQKQVAPLVNKCNELIKKYTKEKNTDSPVYQYCKMLLDWLTNVNNNIDTYVNTTGRKSSTFTLFIAQSPDYSTWTDMIAKTDSGGKLQLLSRITFADTIFKMLGKGSTTSKYGLGGDGRKNISEAELRYVSNNRFFGMYDGKTTDGAEITVFKPFLTLNYDDPFEKCWYNGLGKSYGAGNVDDEQYVANILADHAGEEGYSNKYGIHTGTGLLGLTSMYCQGDMDVVGRNFQSGYEFVNDFFETTGLNAKYPTGEDYMFDLSYDGLMLIDNMISYDPSKENSAARGTDGSSDTICADEEYRDDQSGYYNNEIYSGFDLEQGTGLSGDGVNTYSWDGDESDEYDTFDDDDTIGFENIPTDTEQSEYETDEEDFYTSPEDIERFEGEPEVYDDEEIEDIADSQYSQGDINEKVLDWINNDTDDQEFDDDEIIDYGLDDLDIGVLNNQSLTAPEKEPDTIDFDNANNNTGGLDFSTAGSEASEVNFGNDDDSAGGLDFSTAGSEASEVSFGQTDQSDNDFGSSQQTESLFAEQQAVQEPQEAQDFLGVEDIADNTVGDIKQQQPEPIKQEEEIDYNYVPEPIDDTTLQNVESSLIERIDANEKDYLGALTRLIIFNYKTGNYPKSVAENLAYRMNLVNAGYLKSYNMDTPNNYLGPMPGKAPVEVVENGKSATKLSNHAIVIDENSINDNNKVALNPKSMINCQGLNRGMAGIFKNYMQESPDSIITLADNMWKELILSCKRAEGNISTVELTNGQMRVNKKLLNLNGIIDNDELNADGITLASIVNFEIMFKYFTDLTMLLIDEQMLEVGYVEYGRTVIKDMFNSSQNLRTIIIQQENGTLKKITKPQDSEYEQDRYVDNEINKRADRVDFRIACKSLMRRNFVNQGFSSRISNAKLANGANDGASKMHIEKTSGIKSMIGKLGKKLMEFGGDK